MSEHEVRANHGQGKTRPEGVSGETRRSEPLTGAPLPSDIVCSLTDVRVHQ
jgi:hypothetical protein